MAVRERARRERALTAAEEASMVKGGDRLRFVVGLCSLLQRGEEKTANRDYEHEILLIEIVQVLIVSKCKNFEIHTI